MECDQLILPGVGAYFQAMQELKRQSLDDTIYSFASTGRPVLGICLGMQMLGLSSTEFSLTKGLGLCECNVTELGESSQSKNIRLPHVAWKAIESKEFKTHWIFKGINEKDKFYFIHSFAVKQSQSNILALSQYCNVKFASIIENENVIGTQFHPEKSGIVGLKMLSNFIKKT
tara:strand:- start:3930 stop:4448 length:519 start_codon:yes stop_codon:yes gene_type:complete